jgi:hypothetical protein
VGGLIAAGGGVEDSAARRQDAASFGRRATDGAGGKATSDNQQALSASLSEGKEMRGAQRPEWHILPSHDTCCLRVTFVKKT